MSEAPVESRCTPERLKVCKAYCCYIPFSLTDDEVKAGIVKWHPDYPYQRLSAGPDSRCFNLDPETLRCRIYQNRPSACRAFTCENLPPASPGV